MKVKVKLYGHLTELLPPTGEAEIELEENANLKKLLETLDKTSGTRILTRLLDSEGRLKGEYIILINGAPPLRELEEPLNNGALIIVLPQVGGGLL